VLVDFYEKIIAEIKNKIIAKMKEAGRMHFPQDNLLYLLGFDPRSFTLFMKNMLPEILIKATYNDTVSFEIE